MDRRGTLLQAVLRVGETSTRELLATEAAALELAGHHQLAAPRLLAVDLDGAAAGRPALLMTVLAGSSTIPTSASRARLQALGAAAATLHAVATGPRPGLPLRVRPLADVDFAAMRRAAGSPPLLEAAAERVNEVAMPQAETGLVHGDLWQALGRGHRVRPARRGGGPGGVAAGDRPGTRRRGVLGSGSSADHPDRHGDLAALD
jgi:Ser/Thr protein kinase RdoA (MazF antagonist)